MNGNMQTISWYEAHTTQVKPESCNYSVYLRYFSLNTSWDVDYICFSVMAKQEAQGHVLKTVFSAQRKTLHFSSQHILRFYRCSKHLSFVWQYDHLALVPPRSEAAFDWFWQSFRRLMMATDWSQIYSAFNCLPSKINTKAMNIINHQRHLPRIFSLSQNLHPPPPHISCAPFYFLCL